ncbi:hypothetical protein TFKS16_1268 [Tannerella forsythia KS16]|nr:hypothetical protein TFKS16_1268 [Tannerella forsythia KS16]
MPCFHLFINFLLRNQEKWAYCYYYGTYPVSYSFHPIFLSHEY